MIVDPVALGALPNLEIQMLVRIEPRIAGRLQLQSAAKRLKAILLLLLGIKRRQDRQQALAPQENFNAKKKDFTNIQPTVQSTTNANVTRTLASS